MASEPLEAVLQTPPRRFRPYPEYRDSAVEWLGEIPSSWSVRRLKYLVEFQGGGTPTKESLGYWSGDIPWVSPKDMKERVICDTVDKITTEAIANSATRLVSQGAVLIVVRSGILIHSIPVAIAGRQLTLNQDLKALIPRSEVTSEYLGYFIEGMQGPLLVEWRKEGATVESLELDLIANTRVPIPPAEEQRQIVAFLDRETVKIDALVARKQRVIHLLHEKRAALITQTVTKGLDRNASMKNSGVEWLGDVPAHWRVLPIKRLWQRCDYGVSESLAGFGDVRVLTMAHVRDGDIVLPDQGCLAEVPADLVLDHHDLLFNRTNSRELVAKVGLFRGSSSDNVTFASYLVRIRVKKSTDPEYVNYLLNSTGVLSKARSLSLLSVNQANLNPNRYGEILVCLPPFDEQVEIRAALDRETAAIDEFVTRIRDGVDRLNEFRSALISATVTGKIDVREEAA